MYFCCWNLFSRPFRWKSLNTARRSIPRRGFPAKKPVGKYYMDPTKVNVKRDIFAHNIAIKRKKKTILSHGFKWLIKVKLLTKHKYLDLWFELTLVKRNLWQKIIFLLQFWPQNVSCDMGLSSTSHAIFCT